MRILILCCFFCLIQASDIEDAVVKIYTMSSAPDYYSPWALMSPKQGTGSGAIISGNRIITNGHVIQHASYIQVQRNGKPQRVRARVVHAIHDADMAVLTVDDPSFFKDVTPLDFGDLPESQAEVKVYGFPIGGKSLSVTKGVVSRIENVNYVHSGINLLAGQIDAAINPGNSGGPVIQDGKIVGVVMQGRRDADNIGYMVPVNVVQHALTDISDGNYDGFPSLGIASQGMEGAAMKKRHGLKPDQSGQLVYRIVPGSNADGSLQVQDVILSINGHIVADDGTIELRGFERTTMHYLISKLQIGDALQMHILRNGQEMDIAIPLDDSARDNRLVPLIDYDDKPKYFIYGGFVFVNLTTNLLTRWGGSWQARAPRNLTDFLRFNEPREDIDEVVLLLRVLPSDVNVGYHGWANWVVRSVDQKPIRNLKDLIETIEQSQDEFINLSNERGASIVLDRAQVATEGPSILKRYKINSDRSIE